MYIRARGFTLIEVILVLGGFVIMIGVVFSLYQSLFSVRSNIAARQVIVEQTYYTLERLQILLKDFTIDYEEYRNRQQVGCNSSDGSRNVGLSGYCANFSHYGNANANSLSHTLYYCSDSDSQFLPLVIQRVSPGDDSCVVQGPQSFGQYAELFRNRGTDVNSDDNIVDDADDSDLGFGPHAMIDSAIQELYLISPDKTKRLLLRRVLAASGDANQDTIIDGDSEHRYTLQILKLQGLDAGSNHDFAIGDNSVYDGQIDTRACDAAEGFFCNGQDVGSIYSGFRLPADANDGRVDLLDDRITLAQWALETYPTADPEYARTDMAVQIHPYIRIFMNTKLYAPARNARVAREAQEFSFPIQTTFNIRSWYTK